MRMIERSQDLPLAQETVAHEVRVHLAFDDLERDLLPELHIVPLGLVDGAHPAASDQAAHAVRPDALSGQIVFGFGGEGPGGARDRIPDEVFGGVSREQGENFESQLFIAIADLCQVGLALNHWAIDHGAEKLFNALPAFRTHSYQRFFLSDEQKEVSTALGRW